MGERQAKTLGEVPFPFTCPFNVEGAIVNYVVHRDEKSRGIAAGYRGRTGSVSAALRHRAMIYPGGLPLGRGEQQACRLRLRILSTHKALATDEAMSSWHARERA